MIFHVKLTNNKGLVLAEANIMAHDLIEAGVITEQINDKYNKENDKKEKEGVL